MSDFVTFILYCLHEVMFDALVRAAFGVVEQLRGQRLSCGNPNIHNCGCRVIEESETRIS